jgi:hypothetical protein
MLRAMRIGALLWVVLSVVGLWGAGCAYGEVRQVLRAQFASEMHCGEVQIRRRDAWYAYDGPDQYKVVGCGEVRTYTCPDTKGLVSYDKPPCTYVKGDADAPTAEKEKDEAADEPGGAAPAPSPEPAEPEPSKLDDDAK